MSPDPKDKLKKLLALAQRGVDGERENATSILEALLKKHGISIFDLSDEERHLHWFIPKKSDYGRKLFIQTLFSVVGISTLWSNKLKKTHIGCKVTQAEKVEVELRYNAYLKALTTELDLRYAAFVQVNDIFHPDAPSADRADVDLQYLERLSKAMTGIETVTIRKELAA